MKAFTYILFSESTCRHYTGSCDDLSKRVNRHSEAKVRFTKFGTPWTLKWFCELSIRSEVTNLSRRLKTRSQTIQIQHYLMLTGFEYAYLAVIERDTGIFHEPIFIKRDEEFIQENTERIIQWWTLHILKDIAPDKEPEQYAESVNGQHD